MALSQIRIFDIKPSDIVAQFASICFDASLSEIMMALLAGASLMIFHSPEERTGSKLIDTLNLFSITVITLPPSLLSALDPQKLLCIRTIISAGEPCPTVLAYKWTNSSRHFFNAYGPSEAAVCATIYEYDLTTAAQLAKYKTLPIGTPIHNIRTRVVDSQLNDVPVGMPGELLLSGMGVSRKGYIGTINEKNNKAFVTLNQERWYRTGDLVTTIGPDHQMFIYFGRMDNQVKLSGCRIELNEIEAAVLTCPGVTHCIVVLHQCEKCDDDHGALAAYVDGTATTDFIQEHIIQKLPTYMLPTYMIIHSSFFLPTTLSGKVNRQLLATDQNVHCRHTNKTPLTSTEQHMYMLWCQILNKEYDINMVVDPNDLTFAQCGGNSLTIALLHALLLRSIIGGYSQSKYVADMLVLRALRRGLPGAIFRPGRVTGSSISGIGSTEDLFILMLRGCHELGAYPKLKFPYDVTPVDMVSKAIVRIITRPQSFANSIPLIVHLINTKTIPFDEQFKLLNQFSCRTNHLEELPYNEWCKRLIDRVSVEQRQSNTFNPLLPLIPFLQSSFWQHIEQWPVFTRTNDADAVMDMCPEKLFKLYCRVWKRAGWFT
ncbi:unnamed protein product [Rotaria sp. Silwood1]|nr:unnamed protein product [Rotaria sp. Silwood1]CAF3762202.1 unnamed protein product [Rotaria sp. Silwood1]CAF4757378.1 unnamed protein product [Rotaria sp. Silwood1]CAF4826530.1 unnamed protein product [Rotaria sp. Silwood1]CAF4844344.1 unnamed protein product [Rotaria sp. Silwood1]